MWMKRFGCHADQQEVNRCRTTGESEESFAHRQWITQVRESTLALKPRVDDICTCHQKSKTGVSVEPQKGLMFPKMSKRKETKKNNKVLYHNNHYLYSLLKYHFSPKGHHKNLWPLGHYEHIDLFSSFCSSSRLFLTAEISQLTPTENVTVITNQVSIGTLLTKVGKIWEEAKDFYCCVSHSFPEHCEISMIY